MTQEMTDCINEIITDLEDFLLKKKVTYELLIGTETTFLDHRFVNEFVVIPFSIDMKRGSKLTTVDSLKELKKNNPYRSFLGFYQCYSSYIILDIHHHNGIDVITFESEIKKSLDICVNMFNDSFFPQFETKQTQGPIPGRRYKSQKFFRSDIVSISPILHEVRNKKNIDVLSVFEKN